MSRITPTTLLEEAEDDLTIDYTGDIGYQSSLQPKLFIKWAKLLKQETQKLRVLQIKAEKTKSDLWMYYTGKSNPDVYKNKPMDNRFLKSEVNDAISADSDWNKIKVDLMLQEEIVDTLERIVQQIKDRAWSLKNIIEWKKFMAGE